MRDQYDIPLRFAPATVVGLEEFQSHQCALGAGHRLRRYGCEPGHGFKIFLDVVQNFECPLGIRHWRFRV